MAIPAIVWSIVLVLVKMLSPVARDAFAVAMQAFYKTAMESNNQLDDIAASAICKVMNVDVSGVVFTPPAEGGSAPKEVIDAVTNGFIEIGTGINTVPIDSP
jgi:hypothetical protein